jgi:hypothetical protein
MSGNADDPESTIPWPGFVDILSTVIIVFVFFMMMTSVVIFVLAQQDRKKAVEQAKTEAKNEQIQEQAASSNEVVRQLLEENRKLKSQVDGMMQTKTTLTESEAQRVESQKSGVAIIFEDLGVTLTKDTAAFIKAAALGKRITLLAEIPTGQDFTSTRQIALNRALNIRNALLERGVPAANIRLRIVPLPKDAAANPFGQVTVKFDA